MLERRDGLLLRLREDAKLAIIQIDTFASESGNYRSLQFTLDKLDAIFSQNPVLMNPNKSTERHAYIAERIIMDGQDIKVGPHIVSKLVETQLDMSFKLPMGNMSQSEREKLHNEVVSVDDRRQKNIAEVERNRSFAFMQRLTRSREVLSAKVEGDIRVLKEAIDSVELANAERTLREELERERRQRLDELRKSKQDERAFLRISRQESDTRKFIALKESNGTSREQNLKLWKDSRSETIRRTNEEEALFFSTMKKLEQMRNEEHDRKQSRWIAKNVELVNKRNASIVNAERNKIIIDEKRKARAHELFSPKPIPV